MVCGVVEAKAMVPLLWVKEPPLREKLPPMVTVPVLPVTAPLVIVRLPAMVLLPLQVQPPFELLKVTWSKVPPEMVLPVPLASNQVMAPLWVKVPELVKEPAMVVEAVLDCRNTSEAPTVKSPPMSIVGSSVLASTVTLPVPPREKLPATATVPPEEDVVALPTV